jgi:3-deoxy-7-phosphoheptulonate synthase
MKPTQNLHVRATERLITPRALDAELPLSEASYRTVVEGRESVQRILERKDQRMLVIAGPCSIHDPEGALEYARRLMKLREETAETLDILMRVYFEKPRTTIGWKGLVYDPDLDGTSDINKGLRLGRKLMLDITAMGMPTATEFLDPIVPQYLDDLVSWAAIGARTTESQTHREMASGLSMPVGFKNGTDGSLQVALDAMLSARHPHHFLGMDHEGATCVVKTTGNPWGHVVLRGGRARTNYDAESLSDAAKQLAAAKLPTALLVDCSHANSGKQHAQQEVVWQNLIAQRLDGNDSLAGIMLESYLQEGSQPIPKNLTELKPGVSVTDACVGWETTERLIRMAHERLSQQGLRAPQVVGGKEV